MQASQQKTVKVMVLGNSFAGKTSLLEAFVHNTFMHDYKATIGANFLTKTIDYKGSKITAQIWDTAGQERFQDSLTKQYYRGSDACILVFDVTDKESFKGIEKWLDNFLMHRASQIKNLQDMPKILIGNKIDDKEKRVVSIEDAQKCAKLNGIDQYFETSAKELKGVSEAFEYVIKKSADCQPNIVNPKTNILITPPKAKKGCC